MTVLGMPDNAVYNDADMEAVPIRLLLVLLPGLLLAAGRAPVTSAAAGETALHLPATFIGTLPCHDCTGIRAHLDLWPDGTYHLGRSFIGKPGRDDDLGRWRRDPGRAAILLYGGREMPLQFAVASPGTLRALDLDGRTAGDGTRPDLVSDGRLRPTDLSRGLHGMFRCLADAALFKECLTGRSYPVATEGDYLSLERAMSHASLAPQYWRVLSLRDAPTGTGRCPSALQAPQRLLLEVLAATTAWSIQGQGLELLDAAGQPLAVLEAVYLR